MMDGGAAGVDEEVKGSTAESARHAPLLLQDKNMQM